MKPAMPFVEAREGHGGKVHGPETVVDFFEGDIFADQGVAQKQTRSPHQTHPLP